MRVLLATDGSTHAERAARFLSHLPCIEPEELFILSVLPVPTASGTSSMHPEWLEMIEQERYRAEQLVDRTAKMFEGFAGEVSRLERSGHVAAEIIEAAEQLEVDLVVIGARGHTTLDRVLLGSVSDKVATHARTSVLVVRPTDLENSEKDAPRLTVAYDGSEASDRAVENVAKFQWGAATEVDVLTVVPSTPVYWWDVPVDLAPEMDTRAEHAQQVAEAAARRLHDVAPRASAHVEKSDHVGDAITRFADRRDSDVIVVGDHGHGAVGRFLLGSVSHYVLRHADCSVWVVRSRKRR